MKYLIQLFIVMLWGATAWGQTIFDPNNPQEPDMKYYLALDVSPANAGTVSPTGRNQFTLGQSVRLDAYANTGYRFIGWKQAGNPVSESSSFDYTIPETNSALTACFVYDPGSPNEPEVIPLRHKLFLSAFPGNGGSFNVSSGSVFTEGQTVSLYAYTNSGYVFEGWKLGNKIVSTSSSYDITIGKNDLALKGVFRYDPVNPDIPNANNWNAGTGELVVDNFTTSRLIDAVYTATGGAYDRVLSVIVAGAMDGNDMGAISSYLSNCTFVDLSRATALTYLPSYCFNYRSSLTSIILPSQLTNIGDYAFVGCNQLTEIVCNAVEPPALGWGVFEGVAPNTIVRVPQASIARYLEAAQWNQLIILPLSGDLGALTVSLPASASAGQYKNMTLEMVHVTTAQKLRFTITDRLSYTFGGLAIGAVYHVYVKNQNGVVLGELKNVKITGDDTKAAFDSLLELKDVTLSVKTPAGVDVTDQTIIRWYGKSDNFLGQGNNLKGVLPGVILKYKVELNSALGAVYVQPVLLSDTVVGGDNNLQMTLQPIVKVDINGVVKDQDGNVIANAIVSVSQLLNGKYSKNMIVQTDANGLFTVNVYNDQSTVTVSCKNYISQTISKANFNEGTDLGVITLEAISGVTITTNLTYRASVPAGETPVTTNGYANYQNLSYTLYNKTKAKAISNFSVQYPSIVLLEPAAVGDVILLTVASRTGEFKPVSTEVTIGADRKATATLNIVQKGSIKATYTSSANATNVGILYNVLGQLISQYAYSAHTVKSADLEDGSYYFVSMADSKFFNSVYNLSELTTAGLVANTDYIIQQVTVSSGVVSVITNASIPKLDETKLYYTGSNTSFTASRSSVVAGNYQTLRAQLDFKDIYKNAVSDVKIIVDIPDSCSFVNNSVMIGSSVASGYTINGNQLILPLANYASLVRFCIIPLRGAAYAPSAFVEFVLDGKTIRQPIGAANFSATDLSLVVPKMTAQKSVTVLGTAAGGATVKVYDNEVLVGQTTALANGNWSLSFDLYQPGTYSKHAVYAEVHTKLGLDLISETKTLIYDEKAIEISKVTMINVAHPATSLNLCEYITPFDYLYPLTKSPVYWYWPSYPTFTFKIDFTRNDTTIISNVILYVYTQSNRIVQMTTTYDKIKKLWMATGDFGSDNLPINVGVYYVQKGEVKDSVILIPPKSPSADAIPVQDPSGYVYEAVATNRLQGVTTTVYYKTEETDMYGDKKEVIALWDAEEYGQENPLVTDENGMYAWDVPLGTWQVKYEKAGYQTTYSAWLPVPPPQLDVNAGMVQNTQPTVVEVKGYEEAIDIEFDKYMQLESIDAFNITVTRNGDPVSGTIVGINDEPNPANATQLFASKVRFVPAVAFATTDEVVLTISRKVKSYAGITMANDFSRTVDIHFEAKTITVVPTVAMAYNTTKNITVTVDPKEASAGMKITATSASPSIATVTSEATLDANGQAVLTIKSELPGNTSILIAVVGVELKAEVVVAIAMPAAETSIVSGDSNEDGKVNVYDVANVVDYIIAKNPSPFNFTASDVVADSKINVYDVAGIVYIILHPASSPSSSIARTLPEGGRTGMLRKVDGLLQLTTSVPVQAFDFAYTGEIHELKALDGFALTYYEKDGQQRVIAYSLSKVIPIGTSDLFECTGDVTVSDLMFADRTGAAIEMNDQVTTSLSEVTGEKVRLIISDGMLRVESADEVRKLEIITMQGQTVVSESSSKVWVDQLPLSIYTVRVLSSTGEYIFKEQLGK